jgi:hypothetical protein
MGLDIRTGGKENRPVYAIGDGFVSRVLIEPDGYGKAIFLQHPDGKTSVYAHLNRFYDSLESFVRRQQYATQSWRQNISCAAGAFPVKKGELIAYSGNTGRSEGPHLHFELRDTRSGKNLNPSLYGFTISDHVPPVVQGLYWYDRRYSTYERGPTAIPITGEGGVYRAKRERVRVSSPLVSLGIRTYDRVNDAHFRYGIYRARLWLDDRLIFEEVLNEIADSDSRYVNACIDYSYRIRSGLEVRHLSRLRGNRLPVFKGGDGLIYLTDTLPHRVTIQVADVAGNVAGVDLVLQRSNFDPVMHDVAAGTRWLAPGRPHMISNEDVKLRFDQYAFYDSVPFLLQVKKNSHSMAASARVSLYKSSVPVHSSYRIAIKTSLKPGDPLRQRTVMQLTGFRNKRVVKGSWEGNYMSGYFNELGVAELMVDNIPPVVEWQGSSILNDAGMISISAKDNLSGIALFRAELDRHWVLFEPGASVFTYSVDAKCKKGRHSLMVSVSDIAGNTVSKRFYFEMK